MGSWLEDAACKDMGHEVFYPEDFPRKRDQARAERVALETCRGCSVVEACLADALSDRVVIDQGVRGGTTETERRQIRRRAGQRVSLSLTEKRAQGRDRKQQSRAVAS